MRLLIVVALTAALSGCSEEAYTPNPPQPDTSLEIGDEGVIRYAGYICDSKELYEIGAGEATEDAMDTLWDAYDNGHCTPEDEENLNYRVLDKGPIVKSHLDCKLGYMTTIDTDKHGVLYVSSDEVPGITQEQTDYRSSCLKKLRDQES